MEGRGGVTEPHPVLPQTLTSSHCWHGDQTVISSCLLKASSRGEKSQKAPQHKRGNHGASGRDGVMSSEHQVEFTCFYQLRKTKC